MTPLTQKTVAYLKKEQVSPNPRWYFSVIRILWIGAVVGAVLLSGILTAISLHITVEMNWSLLLEKRLAVAVWILLVAPVLWICLLSVVIFIASQCFRNIHQYYRYSVGKVALVFFLISFLLALLLEFSPLDNQVEDAFLQWAAPQVWLRDILR